MLSTGHRLKARASVCNTSSFSTFAVELRCGTQLHCFHLTFQVSSTSGRKLFSKLVCQFERCVKTDVGIFPTYNYSSKMFIACLPPFFSFSLACSSFVEFEFLVLSASGVLTRWEERAVRQDGADPGR